MTVVVGLATALGTLTGAAPVAHAAASWTRSSAGVLYPSCLGHVYSYSLSLPAGWADWDMTVDLIAPDGTSADSDFLYSPANPTAGASSFLFCGYELPGRYTIRASGEWYDSSYNPRTFSLPDSSFVMRKARSRTQLSVSTRRPRRGQVVGFRVRVRDERPRGFFRTRYASVVLQSRTGRSWTNVRGSRTTTNARGIVVIRARFSGRPVRIRARALADTYTASSSRAILIRRR